MVYMENERIKSQAVYDQEKCVYLYICLTCWYLDFNFGCFMRKAQKGME